MVIDLGFFEVLNGVYSDVELMCSELVSLSIVSCLSSRMACIPYDLDSEIRLLPNLFDFLFLQHAFVPITSVLLYRTRCQPD